MELDLRGLECPIPTMDAIEALKGLKDKGSTEAVVVVLDDAVCAEDIPFQAGRLGYEATTEETGVSEWTIRLTPA